MKKLLALSTLFMATSALAAGGFQGNNAQAGGFNNTNVGQVMTIAQAKEAKDNSIVTLEGNIVKQIDKDEFIFRDASGEIKIEVEDEAWNGQNITPSDKIRIEGKLDKEWNHTDLDVFRIQKL
ncbi:TIGR00156 family protein [Pasteurellaceae bacterium RH1A]|nr:TIGR00156 family protein [Pasteurellaceae bacterium RH1A]